jgi:uncharacterized protein YuzE
MWDDSNDEGPVATPLTECVLSDRQARMPQVRFRDVPVSETRDLDENTTLDLDAQGDISAIAVEHASERAGIPAFSYEAGRGAPYLRALRGLSRPLTTRARR